jgi:RNA polymerase sigma factor (sigma-70 family)
MRGSQVRPWLFKIATRVAIDGLQRRRRSRVVSLNQKRDCPDGYGRSLATTAVADNWAEPSREAIKAEQKEQVRRAIALLPEKQRATLDLASYQNLSYRAVAQVMNCSNTNV